jgi:hypothetical protein
MEEWDPIRVKDTPEAADEYDMYIGGVYRLLEQQASEDEILQHLWDIETGRMEMVVDASKRRAAVAALIALRSAFGNV